MPSKKKISPYKPPKFSLTSKTRKIIAGLIAAGISIPIIIAIVGNKKGIHEFIKEITTKDVVSGRSPISRSLKEIKQKLYKLTLPKDFLHVNWDDLGQVKDKTTY